jgi:hypothetical protein
MSNLRVWWASKWALLSTRYSVSRVGFGPIRDEALKLTFIYVISPTNILFRPCKLTDHRNLVGGDPDYTGPEPEMQNGNPGLRFA